MRPQAFALLLTAAAACGSGRDPAFHRITPLAAVDKIAIAGGHIYWVDARALVRVGKTGGSIETLLPADVVDFAATPGHVYAATTGGVTHFEISATGTVGPATLLGAAPALAIAADANGVSWVGCGTVSHAELDGTGLRTGATSTSCAASATRLALDSSTAYGVDGAGLWYASRSGGDTHTFSPLKCEHIAASGGWLYCSNENGGLQRINPLSSNVEGVFTGKVHTFDIGASRIYAAIGEDLVSSALNTTGFDVLGTYAAVSAISVDSTGVYFVNTDGDLGLMLSTAL